MYCDLWRHPALNAIHTPRGTDWFSVQAECGHFLFACLCVVEVQWFSGGSVRACACISGPVRNREPLSESNTVRERKRENGLGNEPLFSRCCGYRVSTGRLQQMRQWE